MTTAIKISSGYLGHGLDPIEDIIERAQQHLKRRRYDTLVGTGLSGALVVPRLADALDKHFLLVRKPNRAERSHAEQEAEGYLGTGWIFVDDFIASGRTWRRVDEVVTRIANAREHKTRYAGAYLYADGKFRSAQA